MRIDFLLHGLLFSFQLFDSALQKLPLRLYVFHLLLLAWNDLSQFLLEFALKLLDALLVLWLHLLDDFFVDCDLLVERVDDDVFFLFHVFELVNEAVVDGLEFAVLGWLFFYLFQGANLLEEDVVDQFAGGVLEVAECASAVLLWGEITDSDELLISSSSAWQQFIHWVWEGNKFYV